MGLCKTQEGNEMSILLPQRPRRLRQNQSIRDLVQENSVNLNDIIAPMFLIEGTNCSESINSMPGIFRYSLDLLIKEIKVLEKLGIKSVCLFPALDKSKKNSTASEALNPDNIYYQALKEIKNACPDIILMTDVALDPYSSDGHDGLVDPKTGEIKNDETLEILAKMAVLQAKAGADIIGPSDMMDGRVKIIRDALDHDNFINTIIMSYTAKYASGFYGPFRDALDSAPKGDKKTYQMDIANSMEASAEFKLDEQEGADIFMVKPGLAFLDIIKTLRLQTTKPLSVYNVSGEYSMVKAAAEKGWIDGEKVMLESLIAFKRAGANMILTYFAKEFAQLVNR